MKFEINILGCGAATPTLKRLNTAQLLNIHDKLFLIDCGEGTQLQLRKYKFKFQRISHIFISHLHGDHYLGLIGLMSSMHLLGRTKTLHIFGPKGLDELLEVNLRISQSFFSYRYEFHVTNAKSPELIMEDNTLKISSFPLKHRIDCTGFVIIEKEKKNRIIKQKISQYELGVVEILELKKGNDITRENGQIITSNECTLSPLPPRKYVFMSDTFPSTKYIDLVKGADLLYHESTFLEDKVKRAKETMHSTASGAAKFAKLAEVQKLVLGHFSSRYTDVSLFKEEASEHFSNVVLAKDGLSIKVE